MHVFALLFSAFPTLHNLPQKYSHPLPNLLIFFFYYYYYYYCCCCCYDYDCCDCDYYPPTHPSVPLLSRSETSPRTNEPTHTRLRAHPAQPSFLARAANGGRIRRASTIAFTDGASTAAFNDDLKTLSKSLEFMTATLEGMLSEELRPAFVTCDEDNLVRFAAINRRIAVLTQQLKVLPNIEPRKSIDGVPTGGSPLIERAISRSASLRSNQSVEGEAMPSSPVSPSTLFGSRDAKVGVEVGTPVTPAAPASSPSENGNLGLAVVGGGGGSGGGSGDADNHDSPGKPKKKQRLQMVRKAWHSLTHKNFFPPRVMPVGEKYIKEKFEEMDQVRAFFFFLSSPSLLFFEMSANEFT